MSRERYTRSKFYYEGSEVHLILKGRDIQKGEERLNVKVQSDKHSVRRYMGGENIQENNYWLSDKYDGEKEH